ncbi:hypothetical protein [Aquimarina sp. AU58]|uniref:hypothetical protein n=1 Tax=Aquimarina sp. AU58 TaxID=1874112 RepID=UPI0013567F65|nr:hypothetical protein [Aquimarina sp. AU58]
MFRFWLPYAKRRHEEKTGNIQGSKELKEECLSPKRLWQKTRHNIHNHEILHRRYRVKFPNSQEKVF